MKSCVEITVKQKLIQANVNFLKMETDIANVKMAGLNPTVEKCHVQVMNLCAAKEVIIK